MYRSTFKGGCHPFEGKEMSSTKPVVTLEPGPELVFPLSQHAGAPAVPVVKAGVSRQNPSEVPRIASGSI